MLDFCLYGSVLTLSILRSPSTHRVPHVQILAKPKIMPLKSVTLEKIEQMEREAAALSEKLAAQQKQGPSMAIGGK